MAIPRLCRGLLSEIAEKRNHFSKIWRKGWDSNPRGSVNPLAVFKTAALNHSATLPTVTTCKLVSRGKNCAAVPFAAVCFAFRRCCSASEMSASTRPRCDRDDRLLPLSRSGSPSHMEKRNPDVARAPKVSFVSLGCPKALVDSERIITRLRAEGYDLTRAHEGADVVDRQHLRLSRQRPGGVAGRYRPGGSRERQGDRHRLHGRGAREDHRRIIRASSPSPARSNTRAWSMPCIARCRRSTIRSSICCRPRASSSRRGTTPI